MTADQREGLFPPITFKQALIETTFKLGRVYQGPDVVDLATIQPDYEALIDFTLAHPTRHEGSRQVYVHADDRVTINKNITEGEFTNVKTIFEVAYSPLWQPERRLKQNKFVGSLMHSHPVDSVFSPVDLRGILLEDGDPFAHTSISLITPVRKQVVFRGKNTPHLSGKELDERIEVLSRAVNARVRKFVWQGDTAEIIQRATLAMFRQLVVKYDLQVFEGGVRDRYVRRVVGDQIAA